MTIFSFGNCYTFFLKHKVKTVKLLHKDNLPVLEKCLYTHSTLLLHLERCVWSIRYLDGPFSWATWGTYLANGLSTCKRILHQLFPFWFFIYFFVTNGKAKQWWHCNIERLYFFNIEIIKIIQKYNFSQIFLRPIYTTFSCFWLRNLISGVWNRPIVRLIWKYS